jgi:hypothetical protein
VSATLAPDGTGRRKQHMKYCKEKLFRPFLYHQADRRKETVMDLRHSNDSANPCIRVALVVCRRHGSQHQTAADDEDPDNCIGYR